MEADTFLRSANKHVPEYMVHIPDDSNLRSHLHENI
jgi:hypothetical protein